MEVLFSFKERLFQGALLSFELSIYSLILSLIIGAVVCLAQMSERRIFRYPANIYSTFMRGVPDLVQLFLIFYGGQYLLNYLGKTYAWKNLEMTPFTTGVIALALIFGAYMAEAFRGGFMAIPKGQIEAAKAFGLSPWHIFWRISRPQMLRYALPSLGNNWLVLMKSSSLVSIIGLQDLVYVASASAKSMQRKDIYAAFWFYGAIAAFYLLLTTISILILWYLQRRYGQGFEQEQSNA